MMPPAADPPAGHPAHSGEGAPGAAGASGHIDPAVAAGVERALAASPAPNTAAFARLQHDPAFVPPGFRLTERSRVIGHGEAFFGRAAAALLTWQVQRGSAFVFVDVPARVEVGSVSVFRIPFGPLRPRVICRVYELSDTPTRVGFSHVALAGHPQFGWESYHVERNAHGQVRLVIRVVWRPAAWWMRVAGPLTRVALALVLRRNLAALGERVRPRTPGRPD
ncbi:DUF1990 family protein [Subtercola sp. YIM 133946]|uniref:DUF1990 family protein n=1 Tax=Subtercola sp. YIM 133946 TaxID=3118909 RepID=UPI002F939D52